MSFNLTFKQKTQHFELYLNISKENYADTFKQDIIIYSIEDFIIDIRFHKLGHGMISPVTDFIFGKEKELAQQNIDGKIFFAHTDLSGISIFEEAFHQGINAAKQMTE